MEKLSMDSLVPAIPRMRWSGATEVARYQQRPVRVCYVITTINTAHAGTEGHLLRLIPRLDRQMVDPHLAILQRSAWSEKFHDPAVPTTVFDFRSFWRPGDWNIISQLERLFRQLGTDVAELHFTDAHFIGALAARRARLPVVIACRRDLGHQLGFKERLLHRIGNRFVHHFAANSQEVVRHFSDRERIPVSSFSVLHNGLELEPLDQQAAEPLPAEIERQLGSGPVLAMAANLRPVKNHSMLLAAVQQLRSTHPELRVLLLGAGDERERLEREAAERGIADQLVWAGSVPSTAPYLRRSTIGCLTSWTEGFSNAIIEAMAAGLPVIATRTGGAAEAIIEGATGYLVPPGDADAFAARLQQLLDSPALVQSLGQAARQRVEEHFTMAAQLENHYRLYHGLMHDRQSQRP